MQTLPDKDLIHHAQHGSEQAFRILVERHQRFVFNVAYRFTGNVPEAEDITQHVLIKLWRNMGHYRENIKLTTWLYTIITNQCLDFLKSARRKRELMQVAIDERISVDNEADGERSTDREWLDSVALLARSLPDKQQAVFVLRDLQGLEPGEVEGILGMSPDAVKSNLYHARRKMREMLTHYYKETTKP